MILNTLREKAGYVIIGFIGFAVVGFLVSDAIRSGSPFWAEARNKVAEIGGEDISYNDFSQQVQQTTNQLMRSSGQSSVTPQLTAYALQQVWRQNIERIIYGDQIEKLGLATGPEELSQLLTGDNPHPIARQAFAGPQGYSSAQAVQIFQNKSNLPVEQQRMLLQIEQQVQLASSAQKYIDLVAAGINVTSLELQAFNESTQKTATVSYVKLPYASVKDTEVKVEEADLKSYYNDHKYMFTQEDELRSFEYVVFDVTPSAKDTAEVLAEVNELADEFKTTQNDSLFYASNSRNDVPLAYTKKDQLPSLLANNVFEQEAGTVYGPYLDNGFYKIAKVLDVATLPDSVKASHILIAAQTMPNPVQRRDLLDSLKALLQSGEAEFAELAEANSADQASAVKGGDLGYFTQQQMQAMPEFAHAAFFGNTGDLVIVETAYGSHLIKITDQKNASRSVRIAVISREILPGQTTNRAVYSEATAFLSSIKDNHEAFNEKAQAAKLVKRVAESVSAIDFAVPGLQDPREVVRWAYEAELGDVSQLFSLNNKYLVARVTEIRPAGTASLEIVKTEVENAVKQEKKGEILSSKLKTALQGTALSAAANKLGDSLQSVSNLVFANPLIPGVGYEPQLAGAVFASSKGETGGPVVGATGVYAFSVNSFTKPEPVTSDQAKTQASSRYRQQYMPFLFEALKDKTEVVDNRAKFY